MPKRTPLTLTEVRRLLLALPGVEEGPCYGTPGFRVRGRFLARFWEDGETLVVKCGDDERDFRMQADPVTFFTTDHYRGYPTVLVRLTRVRPADLRDVLEQAWRRNAPKRLVTAWEAQRARAKGAGRVKARHLPLRAAYVATITEEIGHGLLLWTTADFQWTDGRLVSASKGRHGSITIKSSNQVKWTPTPPNAPSVALVGATCP